MKKVTVLTDFSQSAWNALFTALKLYRNSDVLFYIVHCYEPSFGNLLGDKSKERLAVIYESLAANSNSQLDEMFQYLNKHHNIPGHQFEKRSVEGKIWDTLSAMLDEDDIDLIVMGRKGSTGAKDVFMGSNTVKVLQKIKNCPILAVPEEQDFKRLDRIVFPTDFSRRIQKCQIQPLKDLALHWNSRLTVLQVSQEPGLGDEQKRHKEQLMRVLEGIDYCFKTVEMKQSVNLAIDSVVENDKADMIALIHYAHTFLERLIREPVIKKIVFHSSVPLLVLPQKNC